MSNNQRFDDFIRQEFENYTPPVSPHIWENIAGRQKKKRPGAFWFTWLNSRNMWLLALLLFVTAAGGAYFLTKKNNTPTVDTATAVAATANNKPATTPNNFISENNDNNNATTTVNTNTTVVSNTTTPSQITSSATPYASSSNNVDAPNNNAVSNDNANNIATTYSRINKKAKTKVKIRAAATGADDNDDTDGQKQVAIINDIIADESGTNLQPLFFIATKTGTQHDVLQLRKNKLKPILLPDCPSVEKNAAGNKTYFEVYAGPDRAFNSLTDTANSQYLQKRRESTQFYFAFSAGMRYTKVFGNGVSLRTGINFSQITEKFSFVQGNYVQIIYIINAAGDTTGSYTSTGTRYKTTYNKYRTIDVPILAGYEIGNGRWHTNLNAGLIINAYSWQKGEVLDASLQPVSITTGQSNSVYQYKTNIGIGFMGAVSVYYKLTERLHLMAEPYFRYNFAPMNKDGVTFKQKYNTAGLRLGVRLDLR
jgi:hypothetical protein